MKGDVVRAYAQRQVGRDCIDVYLIRYRRAVVKFQSGGQVEEWTQDRAVLRPDGVEWIAFAPYEEQSEPFLRIDGLSMVTFNGEDLPEIIETLRTLEKLAPNSVELQ